jgi:branched-chain amino acid transport system substrate-binding protein
MTENFNEGYISCSKCGHNENASTALKCEICGHQLQKRAASPKPLIFGLILLLGILGGGGYFLFKDKFTTAQTQNTENVVNVANDDKNTSAVIDIPADSPERYSSGERILLRYKSNADAKNGVREFATGNYDEALKFFEKAIEGDRPNPEPQIYLNNTKARLAKSFFTMAVVVPVDNSATSAEEILRGVADAQTKFNEAGGLNGKLLEIAIANDGNDPKIAAGVAQKLSDNPKILAVVGHNSSDASEAALPMYEKNGLAMVSSTSTSPSLSGDIFFRAVISDEISGKGLAKHTATSALKKVAIFYNPQSSYSNNLQKAFTSEFQKLGGQIVREIDMSNPNLLSKDEVKSLQGQADAIILFPNKDFISVAIGILQANGQLPVEQRMKILAGNTMYDPMTITSGANAAEGLIVPVPWFSNTSYGKKAEQRWLGQVNWRTAASYDAIRALTSTLSDNSSRDSILKNLQSVDLVFSETSGDVLRFSSQRERLGQPILVEVTRGTGGPQGSPFAFKPIQHSN